MAAGGGCALALVLVLAVSRGANRWPVLKPSDFRAAQRLWQKRGLANYDVRVRVSGRQPAVYQLQVRNGNVISATRNGNPLKQRRTMGTWSVPGMFGTIAADVANVEKVQQGKADRNTPQIDLRGRFDPRHGFPLQYQRIEKRKFSSNYEVLWEVTLQASTQTPNAPANADSAPSH